MSKNDLNRVGAVIEDAKAAIGQACDEIVGKIEKRKNSSLNKLHTVGKWLDDWGEAEDGLDTDALLGNNPPKETSPLDEGPT